MPKAIDITNVRFGHLVAVRKTDIVRYGVRLWECQCDCGNVVYHRVSELRIEGEAESCGKQCPYYHCKEDLSGKHFERWTVLPQVPPKSEGTSARWLCRCSCGTEKYVFANALRSGESKSCGCLKLELQAERMTKPFNTHRFLTDTVVEIDLEDVVGNTVAHTIIDAADLAYVSTLRLNLNGDGYSATWFNGRSTPLHQLLLRDELAAADGLLPDHISRDRLDNRRSNLRLVTQAQNTWNATHRPGASGYVGVSQVKRTGTWRAVIKGNGRFYRAYGFSTAEDAARWRDAKAIELRGEFAVLNFPREEV